MIRMRYRGTAEFVLSKPLPREAINEIPKLIDEFNKNILRRGAKKEEEAAKIKSWTTKDNTLAFEIVSGTKVRVHVATLRIRKALVKFLGQHRIGIRKTRLVDAEIILDGDYNITAQIPFVKEVVKEGGKTIVKLEVLEETELEKPYIDRMIKLFELKELRAKWGGKAEHWILIKSSPPREYTFKEDPNIILEKSGLMKRYAVGQYVYTPPLAWMFNKLQELFINEVLKPLGFIEVILPKVSPLEVALRSGHLKGAAHNMVFVCTPVSSDPSELESWYDWVYITENPDGKMLQRYLDPVSYYMEYAQCPPFYAFLSKEVIDPKKPLKWYDKSGPSFRFEPVGGVRGLERLFEFHRIEIIWLGEPEQVIQIRNELLEKYEYFMQKVLDLEYRFAWVTPWFLVHAGEIREEKLDLNQPGTIDFEAYLPYKGPREDPHSWLEIGNISIHGTKFTKPFLIKHKNPKKIVWTGCSGFGTERWLLAFLAQHGFDPDNWPEKVRNAFKGIPEPLEIVTYPKPEGKKILENLKKTLFAKLKA